MAAHRGPLVMLTAAVALLTACTGDPPPQRPPTTSLSAPPPTATLPAAPPVRSPLNAAAFEADPCKSLTVAQQQQFGLVRGTLTDAAVEGKSCFYRYPTRKPMRCR